MNARTVVIISPHFAPSGLPNAHRARQFVRHLPEFGWKPIVLTVDPRFYQEKPDPELMDLLPRDLEIIRTSALRPKSPGGYGFGDLAIRSFWQTYRALVQLCRRRQVDLIHFPCPPNYQMLLGPRIWHRFRVPYVLDFTDPWNSDWLRDNAPALSKLWFTHQLSVVLEPHVLRDVSHVVCVSDGLSRAIQSRYPRLGPDRCSVIPFGGEPELFEHIRRTPRASSQWRADDGHFHLLYLGAMWEAAYETLDSFLRAIALLKERLPQLYARVRVHFVGTSYRPDPRGCSQVLARARAAGVAEVVDEQPERLPLLDAVRTLAGADGLLMLGSSEPHYSGSRLLPYLHARKPLLAVLHGDSDAMRMLQRSRAALAVSYNDTRPARQCVEEIVSQLTQLLSQPAVVGNFVDWDYIEQFSARRMTQKLAQAYQHTGAGTGRYLVCAPPARKTCTCPRSPKGVLRERGVEHKGCGSSQS
jgi:glycosyltransferase involved in cell wall biosynthesis